MPPKDRDEWKADLANVAHPNLIDSQAKQGSFLHHGRSRACQAGPNAALLLVWLKTLMHRSAETTQAWAAPTVHHDVSAHIMRDVRETEVPQ